MRIGKSRPLVVLVIFLWVVLSLPIPMVNQLRSSAVKFGKIGHCFAFSSQEEKEIQKLELENLFLRNELERLTGGRSSTPFETLPGNVIFRAANTWGSSLWVDLGKKNNREVGRVIVAKNSPVLVGASVVGVIDYVGESQSRVRLITDSGLSPAVRAVRGRAKNLYLHEAVAKVQGLLNEDDEEAYRQLELLKRKYSAQGETLYLAKGEIRGKSQPLWRQQQQLLMGIGFNYDFSDEYGASQDLRGDILGAGDLLVTTGMDGVFPPGLHVGYVTQVKTLKEGDYFYELEAVPTAGKLNELKVVFVASPLSAEVDDTFPVQ